MFNVYRLMSVSKTTAKAFAGDVACAFHTGTKTPTTTTKTKTTV